MAERRGMNQALLTPEKMAFIQGRKTPGTPATAAVAETSESAALKAVGATAQEPELQELSTDRPAPKRRAREQLVSQKAFVPLRDQESGGLYGQILVPLTTRLHPQTADSLRRACLEQKLARKAPNSQQEIVELAVQHWLKASGYL